MPVGWFSSIYSKIDGFLTKGTQLYSSLLAWSLDRRFLVLGMIAGLFIDSQFLLKVIGQEFFPAVDAGQLTVQVRAPSNLRLDATEKRIVDVEKAIEISFNWWKPKREHPRKLSKRPNWRRQNASRLILPSRR